MGRIPVIVPGNFRIVALCGSTGALAAYSQILATVPPDTGMAFVILTHRRSGRTTRLAKILSVVTRMRVQEVKNGSVISPNCVYVIPAGKDLTTDGTRLWLAPISTVYGGFDGFDVFLTSLAQNTQGRAVAIILSGMGDDGSAALGELRLNGGLTFAQADAKSSGMPTNAVATGNVDYLCSAADIGTLVSALLPLSLS